jgi:hypothetical protein
MALRGASELDGRLAEIGPAATVGRVNGGRVICGGPVFPGVCMPTSEHRCGHGLFCQPTRES